MFKKAIARRPCRNLIHGLTTSDQGAPEYHLAVNQHNAYILVLERCGLTVTILDAEEGYPDSTFVEDTALLTEHVAILARPGAQTRRGEIRSMETILSGLFSDIKHIIPPGTLEPGDVLCVGSHYYIGLSARTNQEGAEQLISILNVYGMTGSTVGLEGLLHLKSGAAFLPSNQLVLAGECIHYPEFQNFNQITVPDEEAYAANCLWINGTVLVPEGFPRTRGLIEKAGYHTVEVDVSEYRKIDGGLSCLSLRF